MSWWFWPACALACVNLLAFWTVLRDKRAAKKHAWRTPERRFVRWAAVGGGLGVLAGFYLFRHKTRHPRLLLSVWAVTLLASALIIFLFVQIQLSM